MAVATLTMPALTRQSAPAVPRTAGGERAARRRRARVAAVRRPPSGVMASADFSSAQVCADVSADWPQGHFRMGRWARLACTLSLVGATVVIAVVLLSPGPVRSVSDVIVRPGDSLWSIALRMDPGDDPRLVVARIRDLNAVDGDVITTGTVLKVPSGTG